MTDHDTAPWWNDDDALLEALRSALHPEEPVPTAVTRTALSCYAWHDIDAELATLTFDSTSAEAEPARTRDESAAPRALTFEADEVTFELEAHPDGLSGLLVAPQGSELELQIGTGATTAVSITRHGYFKISPSPTVPFRLRCLLPDGGTVTTTLITL